MEEKSKTHTKKADSQDVVLDLNFVPQWARKPPEENHYTRHDYSDAGEGRRDRGRRGPRQERGGSERPRRQPRRDYSEARDRPRVHREPLKELPVKVTFLPEQKRLASLVRQIHHSRRAYPLMDLANLLIGDKEGYLVKVESEGEFSFFQCRTCKAIACSEEALRQHVLSEHLTEFYEKEEILADPPSGNFPGVARCRKSGVLLGPPNHHSYQEKLSELHQSRFAHIPLEEYKYSLEVVKDEELIEQWREESRKQVVYKLKGEPEAEALDARRAELALGERMGDLIEQVHRAVFPSKIAQNLGDRNLTHTIHRAWSKENRFPLTMSFSMRAAFRHMHLYLFKAGKVNFVTHIKPNPVRPEDTVANIAEVLIFLEKNPGSTRREVLEVLHPTIDPSSQEAKDALQPLSWLIERGHIIEFFNGTLSVPMGRAKV